MINNYMLDWDDIDLQEDDEDYIESQKRKQKEDELKKSSTFNITYPAT